KPNRAWSSRGMAHHTQARKVHNSHHRMSDARRAPRRRVMSQSAGSGSTAIVEVAFTAPMAKTAIPDRAAARRVEPPFAPVIRGRRIHGRNAMGIWPPDAEVTNDVIGGESA